MRRPRTSMRKGHRLTRRRSRHGTVARFRLDPRHLERVVANLLENALERTPSGGSGQS